MSALSLSLSLSLSLPEREKERTFSLSLPDVMCAQEAEEEEAAPLDPFKERETTVLSPSLCVVQQKAFEEEKVKERSSPALIQHTCARPRDS